MIQKQPISQYSHNILSKPYLLTFFAVCAIGNIGIFAYQNKMTNLIVFFISMFVLSFFTKYYIVIIVLSMVISHLVEIHENFEDKTPADRWNVQQYDYIKEIESLTRKNEDLGTKLTQEKQSRKNDKKSSQLAIKRLKRENKELTEALKDIKELSS